MRILHAISGLTPANGGPPIALAGLAAAQARAGLDVSIVATWRGDPALDAQRALEAQGVRVTQVGPARNPMSRHPDTANVLDDLVPLADVVHVHAVWEQVQHLACRTARDQGVPYVVTPHGLLDPWNMANTRLGAIKKRLYLAWRLRDDLDRAAALHFATPGERDAVARLGLRSPGIVEPFGIRAADFADLPAPGKFRARLPQVGGRKLVTFLGRLDYGKGLEVLIPAFAKVAAAHAAGGGEDGPMLVIVGPDSHSGYRATVETLIDQYGVRERTLLTGMLTGPEKLAALVDSYVLCHPSYHENFGLVVVEALACGCPVIVSDQVHLHPEVTGAGVGAACPVSAEAVAAELGRWLGDAGARDGFARGAREFALSRFDWDAIARRWVGHYERMLER